MHNPFEILEQAVAPLRNLYRVGDVKPLAVCLTHAQFDALCDVEHARHLMVKALVDMMDHVESGYTWDSAEGAVDTAQDVLDRYSIPAPTTPRP